jgi:hypothetical protein
MNYGNGRKAGVWLLVTPVKRRADCVQPHIELALKPRPLIQPSDVRSPES